MDDKKEGEEEGGATDIGRVRGEGEQVEQPGGTALVMHTTPTPPTRLPEPTPFRPGSAKDRCSAPPVRLPGLGAGVRGRGLTPTRQEHTTGSRLVRWHAHSAPGAGRPPRSRSSTAALFVCGAGVCMVYSVTMARRREGAKTPTKPPRRSVTLARLGGGRGLLVLGEKRSETEAHGSGRALWCR